MLNDVIRRSVLQINQIVAGNFIARIDAKSFSKQTVARTIAIVGRQKSAHWLLARRNDRFALFIHNSMDVRSLARRSLDDRHEMTVFSFLDVLQTCACRLPYLLVESDNEKDVLNTGFVFVNRRDVNDIRRKLRDAPIELVIDGRKVLKAQMCTIPFMDKVDECLTNASYFNEELSKKHAEGVLITLNPMVKTDKNDLERMCALYRQALLCMGRVIYTECRKSHPTLAEIDAIYGFSCGPKQRLFATHLECIQKLHIESYRLAVCEDSAHRALRFIEASSFEIEEKQKQKCEALNWLMNCEKSTVQKRCSVEASVVNDESLLSASQYVAPGKDKLDFRRFAAIVSGNEASKRINIRISIALFFVVQLFDYNRKLEADVRSHEKRTSIAYPAAYGYKKEELKSRCEQYREALANTKSIVKRNCIRRYAPYSNVSRILSLFINDPFENVYFQLNYPCGHGTSDNFLQHFDCLQAVRKEEEVIKCEKSAARALDDPSNDPCDAYTILTECMYDDVVKKCGYAAWETEYQYLAHLVGNTVPNCRVKRIMRNARFTSRRR
ncbi:unnamed protein product [Toxocara canis]|uniref:Uncharacterized protein n=1 Tax=Toxocara canis TaxID=6265 RepID=A0A3P7ICE1_TOXCA|nr:unnamed protein product [Toxocara canis]